MKQIRYIEISTIAEIISLDGPPYSTICVSGSVPIRYYGQLYFMIFTGQKLMLFQLTSAVDERRNGEIYLR